MKEFLKKIASNLPVRFQQELKRHLFSRQIRKNRFLTDEKEYSQIGRWLAEGDWVIDVGANIGHYTKKFSEVVGESGRVIAFEPVPITFELLASNVALFEHNNVTLLNMAASESTDVLGMSIPTFQTGLKNYYRGHLTRDNADISVMTFPIDAMSLPPKVRLVKIDAEGHDLSVLKGMKGMLEDSHPVIIIEDDSAEIGEFLSGLGYTAERIEDSHNTVFVHG